MKTLTALLIALILWLTLSGFGPAAVFVLGAATSVSMERQRERERPRPFLRPEEVRFGRSTSRTELKWELVEYDSVNRARALKWLEMGHELPDGVVAVAQVPSGHWIFVYRDTVAWPGQKLYALEEIRGRRHPWHYGW